MGILVVVGKGYGTPRRRETRGGERRRSRGRKIRLSGRRAGDTYARLCTRACMMLMIEIFVLDACYIRYIGGTYVRVLLHLSNIFLSNRTPQLKKKLPNKAHAL